MYQKYIVFKINYLIFLILYKNYIKFIYFFKNKIDSILKENITGRDL